MIPLPVFGNSLDRRAARRQSDSGGGLTPLRADVALGIWRYRVSHDFSFFWHGDTPIGELPKMIGWGEHP